MYQERSVQLIMAWRHQIHVCGYSKSHLSQIPSSDSRVFVSVGGYSKSHLSQIPSSDSTECLWVLVVIPNHIWVRYPLLIAQSVCEWSNSCEGDMIGFTCILKTKRNVTRCRDSRPAKKKQTTKKNKTGKQGRDDHLQPHLHIKDT